MKTSTKEAIKTKVASIENKLNYDDVEWEFSKRVIKEQIKQDLNMIEQLLDYEGD